MDKNNDTVYDADSFLLTSIEDRRKWFDVNLSPHYVNDYPNPRCWNVLFCFMLKNKQNCSLISSTCHECSIFTHSRVRIHFWHAMWISYCNITKMALVWHCLRFAMLQRHGHVTCPNCMNGMLAPPRARPRRGTSAGGLHPLASAVFMDTRRLFRKLLSIILWSWSSTGY